MTVTQHSLENSEGWLQATSSDSSDCTFLSGQANANLTAMNFRNLDHDPPSFQFFWVILDQFGLLYFAGVLWVLLLASPNQPPITGPKASVLGVPVSLYNQKCSEDGKPNGGRVANRIANAKDVLKDDQKEACWHNLIWSQHYLPKISQNCIYNLYVRFKQYWQDLQVKQQRVKSCEIILNHARKHPLTNIIHYKLRYSNHKCLFRKLHSNHKW